MHRVGVRASREVGGGLTTLTADAAKQGPTCEDLGYGVERTLLGGSRVSDGSIIYGWSANATWAFTIARLVTVAIAFFVARTKAFPIRQSVFVSGAVATVVSAIRRAKPAVTVYVVRPAGACVLTTFVVAILIAVGERHA